MLSTKEPFELNHYYYYHHDHDIYIYVSHFLEHLFSSNIFPLSSMDVLDYLGTNGFSLTLIATLGGFPFPDFLNIVLK